VANRERLPNRRAAEKINFEHDGRLWVATISRFADGRVAEIFLDSPKAGAIGELAQESAIVASIAMQCGCLVETLRHAVAGRSAGPLAAALAIIGRPTS